MSWNHVNHQYYRLLKFKHILQALEEEGHNPEEFIFESANTPKKGIASKANDSKISSFSMKCCIKNTYWNEKELKKDYYVNFQNQREKMKQERR